MENFIKLIFSPLITILYISIILIGSFIFITLKKDIKIFSSFSTYIKEFHGETI
jgi:hypothetical protein